MHGKYKKFEYFTHYVNKAKGTLAPESGFDVLKFFVSCNYFQKMEGKTLQIKIMLVLLFYSQ